MNNSNSVGNKLPYETPTLVVKGTVAELTQQQNKDYGGNDGFLFQGQVIGNAS